MDGGRFDQLARGLGGQRTRRSALKTIGAAVLGAVGLAGPSRGAGAAPPPRVGVCHLTGNVNIPYAYILVSPSMAATLQSRGDTVNPDFSSNVDHCGACGHSCWDEWLPGNAYAVCDEGTCGYLCDDGYHDDGYGNCVADESPCEVYSFSGATCFWMENNSGNFCWVPADYDLEGCRAQDSCAAGGGGQSGGGCYKWATSSDTVIYPTPTWPD